MNQRVSLTGKPKNEPEGRLTLKGCLKTTLTGNPQKMNIIEILKLDHESQDFPLFLKMIEKLQVFVYL